MLKKFTIVILLIVMSVSCIAMGFECNNIFARRLIKVTTYSRLLTLAREGDEDNFYKTLDYMKKDKGFEKEEVNKFEDIGVKVLQGGATVNNGVALQENLILDDLHRVEVLRWVSLTMFIVTFIICVKLMISMTLESDERKKRKRKDR